MRKSLSLPVIGCLLFLVACGGGSTEIAEQVEEIEQVEAPEAAAIARHDVVYACGCGPECACGDIATAPGKCSCGEDLVWAHVVKVEGNEALLCTCKEGCECEISADDPTKCACGNALRRVSLEGSGLYYCNCGGSCTCNYVADAPGTCKCGMELITSS